MKYPDTLDYRFGGSCHFNHSGIEKKQVRDKIDIRLIAKLSVFLEKHVFLSWLFCYLAVPFFVLASVSVLAACVGGFILALC